MTVPAVTTEKPMTIMAQGLEQVERLTAAIPSGKTAVLVVGVEWKYGVPYWFRFGVSRKSGEHFKMGVEAETKFTKASTNATAYAAWTW